MHPFFHFGPFTIPAYGFFMAMALCTASLLTILRAKKAGADPNNVLVIICCGICGGLVFGYLLYLVVSYGVGQVIADIQNHSLAFLRSPGLVFYGSLIGGIFGVLIGLKLMKEPSLSQMANAAVPFVPLGHSIGRIGCLFAGCCYGKAYDGLFAIHLDAANIPYSVFPVQLVESVVNLLICLILLRYTKNRKTGISVLYLYLICYSVMRFFLEFFRGDQIRGITMGISTSQWISLLLFTTGTILMIFSAKQAARRG